MKFVLRALKTRSAAMYKPVQCTNFNCHSAYDTICLFFFRIFCLIAVFKIELIDLSAQRVLLNRFLRDRSRCKKVSPFKCLWHDFFLPEYLACHMYKPILIKEDFQKLKTCFFSGPKMILVCLKSVPRTGNEFAGVDVETMKIVSWHLQISNISCYQLWNTLEVMHDSDVNLPSASSTESWYIVLE